jgi:hypothetical protein
MRISSYTSGQYIIHISIKIGGYIAPEYRRKFFQKYMIQRLNYFDKFKRMIINQLVKDMDMKNH